MFSCLYLTLSWWVCRRAPGKQGNNQGGMERDGGARPLSPALPLSHLDMLAIFLLATIFIRNHPLRTSNRLNV